MLNANLTIDWRVSAGRPQMTPISEKKESILIDDEGFLVKTDDWDESTAQILAKQEGIDELTDDRMEIIKFLRSYYRKFDAFPILNYVCKKVQQPRNCLNEEFIDPMKAWKIAGLPKPEGVHFVSVDSEHKKYIMEECC